MCVNNGFCANKEGGLDWIPYDSELEKHAEKIVSSVGSPVYGKNTFELMKYWRTVLIDPTASAHDLEHAQWIDS